MIEINTPNEMDGHDYGNKPPYECWGEGDNILNMHISPEEDQTFQIHVDKATHRLVLSDETEDSVLVTVRPK